MVKEDKINMLLKTCRGNGVKGDQINKFLKGEIVNYSSNFKQKATLSQHFTVEG